MSGNLVSFDHENSTGTYYCATVGKQDVQLSADPKYDFYGLGLNLTDSRLFVLSGAIEKERVPAADHPFAAAIGTHIQGWIWGCLNTLTLDPVIMLLIIGWFNSTWPSREIAWLAFSPVEVLCYR